MRRTLIIAGSLVLFAATGCTAPSGDAFGPSPRSPSTPTGVQTPSSSPSAVASTPPDTAAEPAAAVRTTVRFTSDDAAVDVTITSDNPTTRDFLSALPNRTKTHL